MASKEDDLRSKPPVGQRNMNARCCREGCGDSWHDFKRDARVVQRIDLLARAAEEHRISDLEAHDAPPFASMTNQERIDVILRNGFVAAALGHVLNGCLKVSELQNLLLHQAIMQKNISCLYQ